jgi:hypothetical protein
MNHKTTLFALLMAATICCNAQSSLCGHDSLGSNQIGLAVRDTITIGDDSPRCVDCLPMDGQGCTSIALPSGFNGHFFLNSPTNGYFSAQLTTFCNYLMWDSCGIFPPDGMAGMAFIHEFYAIGNCQLTVCGNIGDTVNILIKSVPSPQEELTPYLDLTTCTTPVSVAQPIDQPRRYWEFDGYYWREVQIMQPNRLYKVK